jgi:hypothetical protein
MATFMLGAAFFSDFSFYCFRTTVVFARMDGELQYSRQYLKVIAS